IHRGKVLTAEDLDRVGDFARYRDVDGDGVPYRTLPGTKHAKAAYFTRGSGHNERAGYTEREDDYVNNVDRLSRKFETMKKWIPAPQVERNERASVGIVCCGTSHWAVEESRDQLTREYGVETSYLRLKGYPFTQELEDFIAAHDHVYVVEQNRDAQLLALMKLDLPVPLLPKLRSIRYYGGMPLDARTVTKAFAEQEGL
ncbi:MAG: 2-oxoacid:acceptor oxidoreductase subunit alpha, partial [Bryobacterales bacterium]|nr:2-oxoacid:acceptor oxidoreductase subunit alpha [Bryobacterales bacterium]